MKASYPYSVFIVDDDPFCLALYEQQLKNLGLQNVSVFDNGADCINHLSPKTDIVFLDYNMKVLNGIEVLKKIKDFSKDIYVVFLSGQEDVQVAVNSILNGAFDYIVKGNNDREKIEEVLGRIDTAKELLNADRNRVVF